MISFILLQGSTNKVMRQLNEMIGEYNQSVEENPAMPNILLLQQIDALAFDLFRRAGHSDQFGDVGSDFMKWYFKQDVHHELRRLCNEPRDDFSNQLMFINLSSVASGNVKTPSEWRKDTTSKGGRLFGKRAEVYSQIDDLLSRLDAEQTKIPYNWSNIYVALSLLQSKIIQILNNELYKGDAKAISKFSRLLESTNNYMRSVVRMNENLVAELTQPSSTFGLFDPNQTQQGRTIRDMAKLVARTPDRGAGGSPMRGASTRRDVGAFTAEFLGGNNNKNWRMTHSETGAVTILRVEKSDYYDYDYQLLFQLKNNASLHPFIAHDDFFYPASDILLSSGDTVSRGVPREFNFAVTEYCQRGDLLSNRRRMSELPADVIASTILNQVGKVAEFMSILSKNDTAYTDIKAENFMLRDNDDVITADLKSIVRCSNGMANAGAINSTYTPPEFERQVNTEQFMVFQIGVMLYMLMVSPANSQEKIDIYDRIKRGELDFSHPVFQSPQGELVQEIIRNTTHVHPLERLTLGALVERCSFINQIGNEPLPLHPEVAPAPAELQPEAAEEPSAPGPGMVP